MPRVLVIDDEPGLQRAIRRVLERHGCRVTSALSGDDGYARAREASYDLILCDLRLPGFSGEELYRRLEAEAPDAVRAITFMTGDTLADRSRRFLDETGRPVLVKPFGSAQLLALVPDGSTES